MTPAHYMQMGAIVGYDWKETMLMCPGTVFDLFELYLQAHGGKRREVY